MLDLHDIKETIYAPLKTLSTALADYEYENFILVVKPKADLFLDAPEMKAMLQEAVAFTGYEKYYALIDTTEHVDSSAEARNYYAKSELTKYRLADAFVIGSLATRLVTNFYFAINKPTVPSKMFNNKKEAMNWLLEQKENNPHIKNKDVLLNV